ncbi:ferric reductase NAD binding domain-containing protein [Dipodascopsis uninucleata]
MDMSDNSTDSDDAALDQLADILDDTTLQITGNQYARYFWYGIVVVVTIFGICNAAQKITLRIRLNNSAKHPDNVTTIPQNLFDQVIATVSAILREASYPQISIPGIFSFVEVPPLGTIIVLVVYLCFVLALEFIQDHISGEQHFQALGTRAAWLAVAQMPLVVMLINKNNLIGYITGSSHSQLMILHKWVARGLLLMATLHFGYQSYGWNSYGLMQLEWDTDDCPPTGMGAYALLLWINLSTLAPFRKLSYEFFVAQHIITFFGFVIALMLHLPSTALYSRVYVYIPVAFYLVDMLLRGLFWVYNNYRQTSAQLVPLSGDVTKIFVRRCNIKNWTPGAHVLLSIPSFGPFQSHPATILNRPSPDSDEMVFLLKRKSGFTRRIHRVQKFLARKPIDEAPSEGNAFRAFLEGPYSSSNSDFAAFDTVILIAASTGVTFTMPVLSDIASRAASASLPVKQIEFVLIFKNVTDLKWIEDELNQVESDLATTRISLRIRLFITSDKNMLDQAQSSDSIETEKVSLQDKSLLEKYNIIYERPDLEEIILNTVKSARGETGIAVCGSMGLLSKTRRVVAKISDRRGVHKGSGAQGIYLHTEGF